jgi:hypothetical protein
MSHLKHAKPKMKIWKNTILGDFDSRLSLRMVDGATKLLGHDDFSTLLKRRLCYAIHAVPRGCGEKSA